MATNKFLRQDGWFQPVDSASIVPTTGATGTGFLGFVTNSTTTNQLIGSTATTGPSVSQGSSGTWLASGQVTVEDTGAARTVSATLTDGTNIIDSGVATTGAAGFFACIPLSGVIASPAGNIRITTTVVTTGTAFMIFNQSGSSKDTSVTAVRIG